MADCDLCGYPQPDTAYACSRCAGRTGRALRQLADLAPELDVTIARQARAGRGGTGSDRHPLPVDLAAAADADAVANTVTTWARHCAEERGTTPPPCCGRGELGDVARWLADQTEWLRHQPEAAEALDELADACALAVRIVDRRIARWYAGPCAAVTAGTGEGLGQGACGADLYARPGAVTIVCRACGTRHDARGRRDWLLDEAREVLAWAELAAQALAALGLPCTRSQVAGWAHRGRLVPRGTDGAGRVLYRVGDVIDLAMAADAVRPGV